MSERLTRLWRERRLLVILVSLILIFLILLCPLVWVRFFLFPLTLPSVVVVTPIETPPETPKATETPVPPETPKATETRVPSATPTVTETPTPTATLVPLRTDTPTPIPLPTDTPTPTPLPTEAPTPTLMPVPVTPITPEVLPPTVAPTTGGVLLPMATPSVQATPVMPGAEARVLIIKVSNVGRDEYVVVANEGDAPQDMTGWRLQADHAWQDFYFPEGFVLEAGASVTIRSGAEAFDQPPTDLLWTKGWIWDDEGDIARLYNAANNLSAQYFY